MKKFAGLVFGALVLVPLAAFAQGGPFFDKDNDDGYGGKVTVCFQGHTQSVSAEAARELLRRGATAGPCAAPGTLVVVKNSIGGDATFSFTLTPRNGGTRNFSIKTSSSTGSSTMSLAPGTYSVTENRVRGWDLTSNTCSNVTVSSSSSVTCTVTNTIRKASISGGVFHDYNGNGRLSFLERFFGSMSGVTVYIDANDNGQFDGGEQSVVTGSNGQYSFTGLTPNQTYHIREVIPTGYVETVSGSNLYTETPAAGQDITEDNFGNYIRGTRGPWWDF